MGRRITVPTVQGPTVRERGFGNVQTSVGAGDFAGSIAKVGRDIDSISDTAVKIYQQEKKKQDQVVVMEQMNALNKKYNSLMRDPDQGALNKKGMEATEVMDPTMEGFDKAYGEIEAGLSNDSQKAMLKEFYFKKNAQMDKELKSHASTQADIFDKEQTNVNVQMSRENAIGMYLDDRQIENDIQDQKMAILAHGERTGKSHDWIALQQTKEASLTHASIINRRLQAEMYDSADEYFKAHKDELTGSDFKLVQNALEEGGFRKRTQVQSDKLIRKHGLEDALKEANNIDDAKERQEVKKLIRQERNDEIATMEFSSRVAFNQEMDSLEKSSSHKVAPDRWMNMSNSQRQAFEKRQQQLRQGIEPATDLKRYYELEQLAAETPNEFKKMDLMGERPRLSNSDFKKMSGLQASLREGANTDVILGDIQTKNQVVLSIAREMDLDPKDKDDKKKIDLFTRELERLTNEKAQEKGRKLTNEEVRQLGDTLAVEVVTQKRSWWFDETKKVFELSPEDTAQLEFADIPAAEVNKIKQALKRAGIPNPSEDQVQSLFIAKLNQQRTKRATQ